MARVRTVRAHGNAYGADYSKAEGDLYDHPDPQHLIDGGLVALVDPLDHDGDGEKGGSEAGEDSTASRGRRRREPSPD